MTQQLDTLVYKTLRYANDCMCKGIEPSLDEIRAMSEGNEVMFSAAMEECDQKKLLNGLYISKYLDASSQIVQGNHIRITLEGITFLKENNAMKSVAEKLTPATLSVLSNAVQRTITASMGF